MVGTDIAFGDIEAAHRAYTAEALAHAQYDWGRHVDACRGVVPVHFLNGRRDVTVPSATLDEYRAAYDWIDFRIYEDCGQMILFERYRDVLDLARATAAPCGT